MTAGHLDLARVARENAQMRAHAQNRVDRRTSGGFSQSWRYATAFRSWCMRMRAVQSARPLPSRRFALRHLLPAAQSDVYETG
jgi:hypothetical protein